MYAELNIRANSLLVVQRVTFPRYRLSVKQHNNHKELITIDAAHMLLTDTRI